MIEDLDQQDFLLNAIDGLIRRRMKNLHTAMPARVAAVNGKTVDLDVSGLPKLLEVPICFSGDSVAGCHVVHSVSVGSDGIVVFCERDISKLYQDGDTGEPETDRIHSLSDGIFIPIFSPESKAQAPVSGIKLTTKSTNIHITESGIEVNGDLTVNGNTTISGTTEQQGAVTMASTLDATGSANFGSTVTAVGIVSGAGWNGGGVVLAGGTGSAADFSVDGVSLKDHAHSSGTLKAPNGSVTGSTGEME